MKLESGGRELNILLEEVSGHIFQFPYISEHIYWNILSISDTMCATKVALFHICWKILSSTTTNPQYASNLKLRDCILVLLSGTVNEFRAMANFVWVLKSRET